MKVLVNPVRRVYEMRLSKLWLYFIGIAKVKAVNTVLKISVFKLRRKI